jgi:hypothetical protein
MCKIIKSHVNTAGPAPLYRSGPSLFAYQPALAFSSPTWQRDVQKVQQMKSCMRESRGAGAVGAHTGQSSFGLVMAVALM